MVLTLLVDLLDWALITEMVNVDTVLSCHGGFSRMNEAASV